MHSIHTAVPAGRDQDPANNTSQRPTARRGILSTSCADAALDWVVFPALLFVQFGVIMYSQMLQDSLRLSWPVVMATIFAFCVVAGVYRRFLRKCCSSLVLLLLPEIFTNVVLALGMIGDLEYAFDFLIIFTGVLAGIGAGLAVIVSRMGDEAGDYRPLHVEEHQEESDDEDFLC